VATLDNNKYKILLVDDDFLNQRMMSLLLSNEGFSFETASNGEEALKAVQTQQFDLVLMDLQMPVLDGYEATRRIRAWEAKKSHIPIIALTAMLFDEEEIQLCLDAGMDDCIIKPFNTIELFQVIKACVEKSAELTATQNTRRVNLEEGNSLLDIQAALPRFGNDIHTYQEFLDEFIQELPDKIKQFWILFDSGDYQSLSANAHNLKGVSASLGAMQLSVSASKLDKQSCNREASLIEKALVECDKTALTLQENAMKVATKYSHNKGTIQ
jgi:CheY-like chemotaxis protein